MEKLKPENTTKTRLEQLRVLTEKLVIKDLEFNKFMTIIEQIADMILVTDAVGNIIYVNKKLEQVSGYSAKYLSKKTPSIFKTDFHKDIFYEILWTTIKAGRPFIGKFVNKKKDGSCWFETKTISPIFDNDKNIIYFVSSGKIIDDDISSEIL